MNLKTPQYTLTELADYLGATLRGDGQLQITGIAPLQSARSGQISFLANSHYKKELAVTAASAVIVSENDADGAACSLLITDDPYLAYARLSHLFEPEKNVVPGIAASAVIAESAKIDPTAMIAANAVIEDGAQIGAEVVVGAGSFIGVDSIVGQGSKLAANVSIYHGVTIGQGAIIHSGAVLGADGFGFANHGGEWVKIAQLGGVVVGDNVEIGAGTTIDRGALDDTFIGNGVIIDNQVQVAHNVRIGDRTAIAGCTAIAGSTTIGADCTIAGGVGITGHLTICDGVHVTAMSLVTHSIDKSGAYSSGTQMGENRQWRKNAVRFMQLDTLFRRVRRLENEKKKTD